MLSPQASHSTLPLPLRFFCSSSPSLQPCSSTECITWGSHRARCSPWSWQASHDGIYDSGSQLGFSICVKKQNSQCPCSKSRPVPGLSLQNPLAPVAGEGQAELLDARSVLQEQSNSIGCIPQISSHLF